MRGHARGPFGTNSNLRVQNVMQLTPAAGTKSVFVAASPTDPVLIRFAPWVNQATSGGTNTVIIGNSAVDNAYYTSGQITPGSTGASTEKVFRLEANTNIIAKLTSSAVAASLALTITLITGANTQTVVIGGQTYTFNTSLTNTANNVLIGADVTAMAANLASAINAGAGAGTTYGTGTVANAYVTATSALGVLTVTAKTAGSSGNSIAVSETLTNGSWAAGGTVLASGANASTLGKIDVFIDA